MALRDTSRGFKPLRRWDFEVNVLGNLEVEVGCLARWDTEVDVLNHSGRGSKILNLPE